MVIRANFSGSVSKTADSNGTNWNTLETINLPTKSKTETNSYRHLPKWSKIFFDAIYQILVNAGYELTKNESEYSISLWGFKFYVLSSYGSNYYFYPDIAINGKSTTFYHESAYINSSYSDTNKVDYNFTLTLRGSDNMFNLTLTKTNNPTQEYGIIFLAKAIHTPTKEDYFVFNQYIQPQNAFIKKNNLYDYFETSNCILMSTNTYSNYEKHNTYYGVGKGYNKIPLTTQQYDFIIKDMLYTTSDNIIQMGNYYKIGNEIYYSNDAIKPGYSNAVTDSMYLYKVDTVVDS
jgi:hypothetical protein